MLLDEPLIFERGAAGRVGWPVAESPDGEQAGPALPPALRRDDGLAGFPEVSELEVVRHFVRLSPTAAIHAGGSSSRRARTARTPPAPRSAAIRWRRCRWTVAGCCRRAPLPRRWTSRWRRSW